MTVGGDLQSWLPFFTPRPVHDMRGSPIVPEQLVLSRPCTLSTIASPTGCSWFFNATCVILVVLGVWMWFLVVFSCLVSFVWYFVW